MATWDVRGVTEEELNNHLTPGAVVVVSNDAPSAVKAAATRLGWYVCDGTADQVQVQAAVDDAAALQSRNSGSPSGALQRGCVQLTGGRFNFSAGVALYTAVHVTGVGRLTEVRSVGCTSVGLFYLASANEHLVELSNMYLEGNWASGGSCAAVYFDNSGTTSFAGYPGSSPDAYHHIHDLYVNGFESTSRDGIVMYSSTSDNRGSMVSRCRIKNVAGSGIVMNGSSDSVISDCTVGTVNDYGILAAGGNVKINGGKVMYADTAGVYASSGRGVISGFEVQDCYDGIYLNAPHWALSAVTVDTSSRYSLRIGDSNIAANGIDIFNRAGGRYATTGYGIYVDAAHTDLTIVGVVDGSARMTTPYSGTVGSRCFVRVPDSTAGIWTEGT